MILENWLPPITSLQHVAQCISGLDPCFAGHCGQRLKASLKRVVPSFSKVDTISMPTILLTYRSGIFHPNSAKLHEYFKMVKDFIPLLQSLVWPLFIAALVVWARVQLRGILGAIRDRIDSGDGFEAGTAGVKLAPKAAPLVTNYPETADSPQFNPGYYLVHKSRRERRRDQDGDPLFTIYIYIQTDPGISLTHVERVVYHLHPTFDNPDREITDCTTAFEIVERNVWGQFDLRADLYLKGNTAPVLLQRYINL